MEEEKELKKKKKVSKKGETKKEKASEKKALTKVKKKEKVIESKALLDSKSQKTLKVLSKIVGIFAKIGRIALMICIPFVFIAMIAIPFLMKELNVNGNVIAFSDIRVIINDDYISYKVANNDYKTNNDKGLLEFTNFLTKHSKNEIALVSEISLLFAASVIILHIYALTYLEKLFKNIYTNDTPFIEENTNYIRKMSNMMLISAIVVMVFEIILGIAFPEFSHINVKSYGVLEILIAYVIYYIFKYATNLQKETLSKIYN